MILACGCGFFLLMSRSYEEEEHYFVEGDVNNDQLMWTSTSAGQEVMLISPLEFSKVQLKIAREWLYAHES